MKLYSEMPYPWDYPVYDNTAEYMELNVKKISTRLTSILSRSDSPVTLVGRGTSGAVIGYEVLRKLRHSLPERNIQMRLVRKQNESAHHEDTYLNEESKVVVIDDFVDSYGTMKSIAEWVALHGDISQVHTIVVRRASSHELKRIFPNAKFLIS